MNKWKAKKFDGMLQIQKGNMYLIFDSYEYDAHEDYLWIALKREGKVACEIKGEEATELFLLATANGIKGSLFKEKRYTLKREL